MVLESVICRRSREDARALRGTPPTTRKPCTTPASCKTPLPALRHRLCLGRRHDYPDPVGEITVVGTLDYLSERKRVQALCDLTRRYGIVLDIQSALVGGGLTVNGYSARRQLASAERRWRIAEKDRRILCKEDPSLASDLAGVYRSLRRGEGDGVDIDLTAARQRAPATVYHAGHTPENHQALTQSGTVRPCGPHPLVRDARAAASGGISSPRPALSPEGGAIKSAPSPSAIVPI